MTAKGSTKAQLAAVLEHHIGAENGISAEQLALALGCEARMVRVLVTELREDAIAVCGHPKTGYFIAANDEELAATCQFLRARALHSLTLESKLSKKPLAELLGQMRLND